MCTALQKTEKESADIFLDESLKARVEGRPSVALGLGCRIDSERIIDQDWCTKIGCCIFHIQPWR